MPKRHRAHNSNSKDDTRAIQLMRAEAERRGWLLWPSRKQRSCAQHGYYAEDIMEPCGQCFREAMDWQLTIRTKTMDITKIPDVERSEFLADQLDHYAEQSSQRRKQVTIAQRAASVRVGKKANGKAECKPRMARKKKEVTLWV